MRNTICRRFDWSYLVLAPGVFLTYFVPIRFRFGAWIVAPFILMWLLWVALKSERTDISLRRAFLRFFVPLAVFVVCRVFLFGLNAWDGQPLQTQICTYGLFLIYTYIFYYSVAHRKYKELFILNLLIMISLSYGTFSYMNYEMGSYRNQVKGKYGESYEQTINRLERAFDGATNYGDAYAMVYIVVAIVANFMFFSRKWKVFSLVGLIVFVVGVYRASYSTGTVVMLYGSMLALVINLLKLNIKVKGRVLFVCATVFVVINAFPTIVSFLGPVFGSLGDAFESISHEYSLRLHSMAEAVAGYKDTYAVQRADLYWRSMNRWFEYPLFGFRPLQIAGLCDPNLTIGGHSYLFDSLACGGIFMGVFMVAAILNFFKFIKLVYAKAGIDMRFQTGWYCVFWMMAICGSINQVGQYNMLICAFFLVPSIPFFDYKHNIKVNEFYPLRFNYR